MYVNAQYVALGFVCWQRLMGGQLALRISAFH